MSARAIIALLRYASSEVPSAALEADAWVGAILISKAFRDLELVRKAQYVSA